MIRHIFKSQYGHEKPCRWALSAFLRGLGVVYLIAFLSLLPQISGLIGADGIMPAASSLARVRGQGIGQMLLTPTIFWLGAGDAFLKLTALVGACLSLLLIAGATHVLVLGGLWISYLSLVNVGGAFLPFIWDLLLLEAGFVAVFLSSSFRNADDEPSMAVVWALRWLLFRLMFEMGYVKVTSAFSRWNDLSFLQYFYLNQPMPSAAGWCAAQMPVWAHQACAAATLFIETVVPFFIFAPRKLNRLKPAGFLLFFVFQSAIFLSGNYGIFNILTIALSFTMLENDCGISRGFLELARRADVFGRRDRKPESRPGGSRAVAALMLALMGLSGFFTLRIVTRGPELAFWDTTWLDAERVDYVPRPLVPLLRGLVRWRIASAHDLFSHIPEARYEIVISGSDDGKAWSEYQFKYKLGDTSLPPPSCAPYQPRLDYKLFYVAVKAGYGPMVARIPFFDDAWFSLFLEKLKKGDKTVGALLKANPFPEGPRFIRADVYEYAFTSFARRRQGEGWWERRLVGPFLKK